MKKIKKIIGLFVLISICIIMFLINKSLIEDRTDIKVVFDISAKKDKSLMAALYNDGSMIIYGNGEMSKQIEWNEYLEDIISIKVVHFFYIKKIFIYDFRNFFFRKKRDTSCDNILK